MMSLQENKINTGIGLATHLQNEETRPTTTTGKKHESAGDPMFAGYSAGDVVALCLSAYKFNYGAFVPRHQHRSTNCDYSPDHLCNARQLLEIDLL